ncbi:hypothetical protein [Streptomyces adelaidensis]|uniref:hypothetical protein n=1 Tax=Streptomyces adelaidensis TaxID=2796465 RepID=UPI001906720C|nr:hypothetical protein [Streptomyces adelaidensis]
MAKAHAEGLQRGHARRPGRADLLSLGVGVQRIADPTIPTAVLTDTLRLVLRIMPGGPPALNRCSDPPGKELDGAGRVRR